MEYWQKNYPKTFTKNRSHKINQITNQIASYNTRRNNRSNVFDDWDRNGDFYICFKFSKKPAHKINQITSHNTRSKWNRMLTRETSAKNGRRKVNKTSNECVKQFLQEKNTMKVEEEGKNGDFNVWHRHGMTTNNNTDITKKTCQEGMP